MIDHIGLRTADLERLKRFYSSTLKPLSITMMIEYPGGAGFGRDGQTAFWLGESKTEASNVHVAFQACSRSEVDAFHAAALDAGAVENDAPGLRPHYHDGYYAAYVFDPDGNNIEAVCHQG